MLFKLWSPHERAGRGGGNRELLTRPSEKVLKDVRNGFVSNGKAKNDYEVMINPITLGVNEKESNKMRALK
jgi:N-methylhydantoinase B